MRILCSTLLLLFAALSPRALLTQPAGTIRGLVTDRVGVPVAGARVAIGRLQRQVGTDSAGRFRFTGIPRGLHTLSVARLGFAAATREVRVGDTTAVLTVILADARAELATVQVSASAAASTTRDAPQAITVVAGAALRAAQGASIGDLLADVPGVRSLSMTTGIGKPVLRGLTHNRVVMLDNGQRSETQQWGHDHSPNIETANAEQVEVIKGPASVLYGSDALGGVVNVIQAPVPDAIGQAAFVRGRLTAAYHDVAPGGDATVRLEGARGGLGARVALTTRASNDMQTPRGVLANTRNAAVAPDIALAARGARGSVTARYTQRDERIEIFDDPVESPGYSGYQRLSTQRAAVDATLPIGLSSLQLNAGWESNFRREYDDAAAQEIALGLLVNNWTGFAHWAHPAIGPWRGTLGVSALQSAFEKRGTETLIPSSVSRGAAVYLLEQATFGRVAATFGARVDHRTLRVDGDEVLGLDRQQRDWQAATGSLGLRVRLSEPVAFVASVARGFRAPAAPDLFANGFHEGTRAFERGNPDLRVETSVNSEVGVRVNSTRMVTEVNAYHNAIADYIYLRPFGTGARVFDSLAVAQGNARLVGVEGRTAWRASRALTLDASGDWVIGDNRSAGVPLTWIPPARLLVGARVEGVRWHGVQRPYLRLSGEGIAAQRRIDPRDLPTDGYALASVTTGGTLLVGRGAMTVDLSVRNLFGTTYLDFMSRYKAFAVGPGRALSLRVSTEF
jgi:iron complex outermembrane recepter protein